MKTRTWLAALAVGVLGLTGCGTSAANREAPRTSTHPTGSQTAPAASPTDVNLAFYDTFDDDRNKWGVVDDPVGGSISFADGDYIWKFKGRVAHWLPEVLGQQYDRGELKMRDVAVRADLTIHAGGGLAGVGCRENRDTDADFQWYEFVARDGFAAIRQSDIEGNIAVLAKTDQISLPTGKAFTVEGVCVNDAAGRAHLTMRLNGNQVLQTTRPDPLENGVPALQAWTYPRHSPMEIRWHEFSVRTVTG
jgi:hypothetical protein